MAIVPTATLPLAKRELMTEPEPSSEPEQASSLEAGRQIQPNRRVTVFDGIVIEPPADDTFMNPEVYFSEPLFDLERKFVFPSSWVFVGDLSQLRKPGDYITETIGHEPVLVTRGRDRVLRAFVNVCPHRASPLAQGTGNCGRRLVCPYHGWTFELDGRLVGIPYRKGFSTPINRDDYRLREVPLGVWQQFVFVNVSGDAPPLLEWLYPMPEQLSSHGLKEAAKFYEIDDEVNANWKVMMDNAYCDYHLPYVHGDSIGQYADLNAVREDVWDYTGRIITRWTPEQLEAATVRPELTGDASTGAYAFSVFPNWFIAAFPNGGAMVMWWTPLSLDRSRARVWSYSPQADDDNRADVELLNAVQREDYAICELVQKGLRSQFYRPGPRHYMERKIHGFQQRLMKMLATAINQERERR